MEELNNDGNRVYLSLGSNLGDRKKNMEMALNLLEQSMKRKKVSSFYETESWGYDDDAYYNAVAEFSTEKNLISVFEVIKYVENQMGRLRREKSHPGDYSARIIDLDILYYNDLVFESDELVVPHPRLHLRNFVLVPLLEVNPDFFHPVINASTRELLSNSKDDSKVVEVK